MLFLKDVENIGVDDVEIELFEGQYPVKNGMRYNSYVIRDEHVAVIDTVDERFTRTWLAKLKAALGEREPTYLIVQHMEPDHSGSLLRFMREYPRTTVIASAKAFDMMSAFYGDEFSEQRLVVADGDTLSLGRHKLHFIAAPMVHWPEVMMTFDSTDGALFSADAFGKFGTSQTEEPWEDEAARYFFGIVAPFGVQVKRVLEKLSEWAVRTICPLHGPVLTEDIGRYVRLYDRWASYEPEREGVVVAYTSVYGHTAQAVKELTAHLHRKTTVYDLARCDMTAAIADAFRYDTLVLATTTYNAAVFPFMHTFLHGLSARRFQNRRVALIENGSWAPTAATVMKRELASCAALEFIADPVTIHSAVDDGVRHRLRALAAILNEK